MSAPDTRPAPQRASGEAWEAFAQRLMWMDWHRRRELLLPCTRGELVKLGQHIGVACDNRWTWFDLHDTIQTALTSRARRGVQLDMFEAADDDEPLFRDE